jgi:hypothetical protein
MYVYIFNTSCKIIVSRTLLTAKFKNVGGSSFTTSTTVHFLPYIDKKALVPTFQAMPEMNSLWELPSNG